MKISSYHKTMPIAHLLITLKLTLGSLSPKCRSLMSSLQVLSYIVLIVHIVDANEYHSDC